MTRLAIRPQHGIRLLVCGLMLLQTAVPVASVHADATGGVVVEGNAMIINAGPMLKVNSQSDRTIINWNQFSIDAGQTAKFKQPGASSAVLNRVITNNPSAILGTIESNGHVLLINPNGILVGPNGVIDTNGFTASVLDITNENFMQGGPLTFQGNSNAHVVNLGEIQTGSGGAALIGGNVVNFGTIESEGGSITLATGGTVTLADGSRFTHADLATIESGLSPYAGVIRNHGTIRATGAIESQGEVYLVNPGGNILNSGSIVLNNDSSGNNGNGNNGNNGNGNGNNGNNGNGNDGNGNNGNNGNGNNGNNGNGNNGNNGNGNQSINLIADVETGASVHISAAGTATIGGVIDTSERAAGDVVIQAGSSIQVVDGAEVSSGDDTVFFSAPRVDLTATIDGNVAGGSSYNGSSVAGDDLQNPALVNVRIGETTRGSIDQALTVVDEGGTVGLGPGEFESFTVERPGLTIQGSGPATVVKTASPAVTVAADNTTIQNMLLLGTGSPGDIGILLDGVAAPGLTGTRVLNVLFFNLDDGILTQGAIGNNSAGAPDLLVSNVLMRAIANQGIDFASGLASNDSVVILASDIESESEAIRFGDAIEDSSITIAGNSLRSSDEDAIQFLGGINRSVIVIGGNSQIRGGDDGIDASAIANSRVVIIGNNTIAGDDDGIDFDGPLTSSNLLVLNNGAIRGQVRGIEFDENLADSNVLINNNGVIRGGVNAIAFDGLVLDSSVSISGNAGILGDTSDAIRFDSSLPVSIVASDVVIAENSLIQGADDAIDIDSIIGSRVLIADNRGILGGDEAIDIDSTVADSIVAIVRNDTVEGAGDGIAFDGPIDRSFVSISGNNRIRGNNGNAIAFDAPISQSIVTVGPTLLPNGGDVEFVGGNNQIQGSENGIMTDQVIQSIFIVAANDQVSGEAGDGIHVDGAVEDSAIVVLLNGTIQGRDDGMDFDSSIDDSLVLIARNGRIIGVTDSGIEFSGSIDESLVSVGGQRGDGGNDLIQGGDDGINFRGAISDGSTVNIRHNRRINGLDDDGIAFDGTVEGSDTSITIARNGTISGHDRGVAFTNNINDSQVRIANNRIESDEIDAILFNDTLNNARIVISRNHLIAGDEGIDVQRMNDGRFLVLRNHIESGGDGIEIESDLNGTLLLLVRGNTIDAGGDGIRHENGSSINDRVRVAYINNEINVDGGSSGIRIANVNSNRAVLIRGGEVNGGAFGIEVDQLDDGLDGRVIVDGLVVNGATDTGLQFTNDSEASTLGIVIRNGVTVNGGASADDKGLVFDGPGLSLTGNTLNDTKLYGQNGNFIELRNGALFEPGRPTLIDATGVDFDGINPTTIAGRQAIIDKLVDYLDNPTLGLIFPGAGIGSAQQTYDRFTRYEDYFRTVFSLLQRNVGTIFYPAPTVEISEDLQ